MWFAYSKLIKRQSKLIKDGLVRYLGTWKRLGCKIVLDPQGLRETAAVHELSPHKVMTGQEMQMPEQWWVAGDIPEGMQT